MVVHAPVHEVCPKNSLKINISSFQPVLFGTIPSEEWAGEKNDTHTAKKILCNGGTYNSSNVLTFRVFYVYVSFKYCGASDIYIFSMVSEKKS